jgi:hypothetical protein
MSTTTAPFRATSEDLAGAARLLKHVRTSQEVKLRYGAMKRQELRDKLNSKEPIEGYRADWLKAARDEMVQALGEVARKFNAKYPHDCCSVADLGDVISSVAYYLRKAQADD